MHSNSTDAELLERAVEEPVLFAALFERHGQAVRRYAIRRIGEAGDDVTSEVFVRAFRGRAGYRADHVEALPWLLGIANNGIADHRRLGRPGLRAPEPLAALRALPAVERDTLLLVVWGELTQEQAALAVGVPVGTISSRITR